MIKVPPYLNKGDMIGITCPAGYMAREKAQTCIETLRQWGYQVKEGKNNDKNPPYPEADAFTPFFIKRV